LIFHIYGTITYVIHRTRFFDWNTSMVLLPQAQTKAALTLVGFSVLLTACGGGSSGDGASASLLTSHSFSKPGFSGQSGQNAAAPAGSSTPVPNTTTAATSSSKAMLPAWDVVSSATDTPAGQEPGAFRLTFKDEFDGELDRETWRTDRTDTSSSTKNYKTENGVLKIWPQRGNNGAFFDRTIDTGERFSQKYGYFEIEAKLPKGKGAWPAFWLFNQIGERRPEIDIMEAYPGGVEPWGRPGADGVPVPVMYAPVTWTDSTSRAGYAKVETPDLSSGFHRYGVKWEPSKQTFYFDGREVLTVNAVISDPLYLIIDLWFGSASGEPDGTTPTGEGNSYEINYVKAWQFK
jgi:beta-glucanase (GH16 family)